MLVAQSHLTLCDPMDCHPPGPSVHENLRARVLEWVAISSTKVTKKTYPLWFRLYKVVREIKIMETKTTIDGDFQLLKVWGMGSCCFYRISVFQGEENSGDR